MVKTSVLLSLAAVAGAAMLKGERDLSKYTYKDYLKEFPSKMNLLGADEMETRERIFNSNMVMIKRQNAKSDKTWHAGPNQFTDMTNEEFKKVYHGHKPAPQGTFKQADLTEFKASDIPDSVDWREIDGVVTAVKDQGSCGSCWAFSATESMESAYAIANNKPAPILSPQQLVSCAPNPDRCGGSGGCDGSTQPLGFNYTMGAGLSAESSYPYKAKTGTCDPSKISPMVINSGFEELQVNDYTGLVTAIANVGPVSISVAAGGIGWQLYNGGVYNGANDFVMDHAVQAVGYGTDGDDMYWIVRNSWGPRWGEKGYMRIKRFGEGKEPCGMDNKPADGDACAGDNTPKEYCGLCGILSSSSYPTGVKDA